MCESISDYSATGWGDNLPSANAEADNFAAAINALDDWSNLYNKQNNDAWEEHFKRASMGGTDYNWVETTELALFVGHGFPMGFCFTTFHDDPFLSATPNTPSDYGADEPEWGNGGILKWVILDSCLCLSNEDTGEDNNVFDRWCWGDGVFAGLHYILGWESEVPDTDGRADTFVNNCATGMTIKSAWFNATITDTPAGRWAARLRANTQNSDVYNDHLPGYGYVSPDPLNSTNFSWEHWET